MDKKIENKKPATLQDVRDAEERTKKAGDLMVHLQVNKMPQEAIDRAITEYNQALEQEKEIKRDYFENNKTPKLFKNFLVKQDEQIKEDK